MIRSEKKSTKLCGERTENDTIIMADSKQDIQRILGTILEDFNIVINKRSRNRVNRMRTHLRDGIVQAMEKVGKL